MLERSTLPRERLDHEAFLAEMENRSNPVGSAGEAVSELAEGRAAAAAAGATLIAAGLHPDAELFDVELVQSERYERVERQMQGLIKRTPECALHVHVGLPDPDAAVAAMNGLRERLPLLHGLGANSPFWFGRDSGMASSRAAVIRAYPGRGIPPFLADWDQYLGCLRPSARAAGPPTTRWSGGMPAHSRGSARWSCARWTCRPTWSRPPRSPRSRAPSCGGPWRSRCVTERRSRRCTGRASERHATGSTRRSTTTAACSRCVRLPAGSWRRSASADPELEGIERIIREGNGADRQRAAHERGGMPGLLRYLADVTRGLTPRA